MLKYSGRIGPALLAWVLVMSLLSGSACSPKATGNAAVKFDRGPDLGAAEYTAPSDRSLIDSHAFGLVASGEIAIMTTGGIEVAERVASLLGGEILGNIEFVDLYQVSVAASDEQGLMEALTKAAAVPGVELAFPNQAVFGDARIKGTQCSPVKDDPVYGGGNARPYEMIGMEDAWSIVRSSGLKLSPVQVGVTDDGLYRGQGEFDGESTFETAEKDDELASAQKDAEGKDPPYGSHGTAVSGIIGANPDNGGQVGVASVLGKNLKVSMTNVFKGKYSGWTTTTPDPNDPTKYTNVQGTYAIGDLVALANQVKAGATVINCSWGNSDADPAVAAAYRRFFEKMATEHPKVLFVCSAGNEGKKLDGAKRFPSGLALPNMITVGCLENDGSAVDYSNQKNNNFEVTLAAPGHRVVSGVGANGAVSNENGGTSFATPQVAAAAAILKSLNPALEAGDIKRILAETARGSFTDPKTGAVTNVPEGMGAGCVALDLAVLQVVNDLREEAGLKPLTLEAVRALGRIDLSAAEDGDEWGVLAKLPDSAGTEATLRMDGEGALGGSKTQPVSSSDPGEWFVTPASTSLTVHVKRADSGACWRLTLGIAPFKLNDCTIPPRGEHDIGSEIEERTFAPLTLTVEPQQDPKAPWRVYGTARNQLNGYVQGAQTFYAAMDVKVEGTFDPDTGEIKADCTLREAVRYDRRTGFGMRDGNWKSRFTGVMTGKVDADADTVTLSIVGETRTWGKSQRDSKTYDAFDDTHDWNYQPTFSRVAL